MAAFGSNVIDLLQKSGISGVQIKTIGSLMNSSSKESKPFSAQSTALMLKG